MAGEEAEAEVVKGAEEQPSRPQPPGSFTPRKTPGGPNPAIPTYHHFTRVKSTGFGENPATSVTNQTSVHGRNSSLQELLIERLTNLLPTQNKFIVCYTKINLKKYIVTS